MGHVEHNAIIVTSWNKERITEAYDEAGELGLPTTDIEPSPINSYLTFVVIPDGSKEGWNDSELGDGRRERFRAWLRLHRYEDGSSPFEWVEVRYGSDRDGAEVVDHEWTETADA